MPSRIRCSSLLPPSPSSLPAESPEVSGELPVSPLPWLRDRLVRRGAEVKGELVSVGDEQDESEESEEESDEDNESHHMDPNVFKNLTIPFAVGGPFEHHTPDFYVPFFTMVEFICYFGWIKVAETLLNPFGDDDEDFKINYQIDRNLQVTR